jgi:hypothetical protein
VATLGVCAYLDNKRKEKNKEMAEAFKQEVLVVGSDTIDPSFDGRAVFAKGQLVVDGPPSDPFF